LLLISFFICYSLLKRRK